jgi:hypothetical protein
MGQSYPRNAAKSLVGNQMKCIHGFLPIPTRPSPLSFALREPQMGCDLPIAPQVTSQSGELVIKEDYQKLVGQLLYICHTKPSITYRGCDEKIHA